MDEKRTPYNNLVNHKNEKLGTVHHPSHATMDHNCHQIVKLTFDRTKKC